jgi:hypothetical protein
MGGVDVRYSPKQYGTCVLELDIIVVRRPNDFCWSIKAEGTTADDAFRGVMKDIANWCRDEACSFCVDSCDATPMGRRYFALTGDIESGFSVRQTGGKSVPPASPLLLIPNR